MRQLVNENGLAGRIEVDSAGTGGWQAGAPPDTRATSAAGRRGVTLDSAARQVTPADFESFDLVVAMDRQNLRDLRRVAPPGTEHKLRTLADVDVPDPYYGGPDGFEDVLDIVEGACARLLDEVRPIDGMSPNVHR
jgi:protein-tyrosine phosphatase